MLENVECLLQYAPVLCSPAFDERSESRFSCLSLVCLVYVVRWCSVVGSGTVGKRSEKYGGQEKYGVGANKKVYVALTTQGCQAPSTGSPKGPRTRKLVLVAADAEFTFTVLVVFTVHIKLFSSQFFI